MPVTPIGSAPFPAGTAGDAVPADIMALAVWASMAGTMKFADAAARNAAIPSGELRPGMLAWLNNPGALTIRTDSAWRTLWSLLTWTDITLESPYGTYGTTPKAAADGGNFVVLQGGVQRSTAGTLITGDSIIGTLPSSLGTPVSGDYPIAIQWLGDIVAGRLYVATNRQIKYVGKDTVWLSLNGVRIPLA